MELFMITTIAFVGIIMETLTGLLILCIGVAAIRLMNAKGGQLREQTRYQRLSSLSKYRDQIKETEGL